MSGLRVYADFGWWYRQLGREMAGYVYGVGAEGVVVLVLSEIGNDEVEMDGWYVLRERGFGVDDEVMAEEESVI